MPGQHPFSSKSSTQIFLGATTPLPLGVHLVSVGLCFPNAEMGTRYRFSQSEHLPPGIIIASKTGTWPKTFAITIEVSINRWINKDVMYIYNEILLSHKKNEIVSFPATQMDLKIILSKVSQKEKDKYRIISFIWGISNMTQQNRNRIRDIENRLVVA